MARSALVAAFALVAAAACSDPPRSYPRGVDPHDPALANPSARDAPAAVCHLGAARPVRDGCLALAGRPSFVDGPDGPRMLALTGWCDAQGTGTARLPDLVAAVAFTGDAYVLTLADGRLGRLALDLTTARYAARRLEPSCDETLVVFPDRIVRVFHRDHGRACDDPADAPLAMQRLARDGTSAGDVHELNTGDVGLFGARANAGFLVLDAARASGNVTFVVTLDGDEHAEHDETSMACTTAGCVKLYASPGRELAMEPLAHPGSDDAWQIVPGVVGVSVEAVVGNRILAALDHGHESSDESANGRTLAVLDARTHTRLAIASPDTHESDAIVRVPEYATVRPDGAFELLYADPAVGGATVQRLDCTP